MAVWHRVRDELGSLPVVAGHVGGESPLYAERYLLQRKEVVISRYDVPGLITLFGGARVTEGEAERWRTTNLPSQALLLPPGCATHWHLSGPSDFGIFYFTAPRRGPVDRLARLAGNAAEPRQFSDALVGAAALQVFNELRRRTAGDDAFVLKLVAVMLEQACRTLAMPETGRLSPRHGHFPRLQKVLPYIRRHLADELPVQTLADVAGLSATHFRRLFQDAVGVSVHRYVQTARLERARLLLGTTTMPIARIAAESGFSSQSHLTRCFRLAHAATPARYRRELRRTPSS